MRFFAKENKIKFYPILDLDPFYTTPIPFLAPQLGGGSADTHISTGSALDCTAARSVGPPDVGQPTLASHVP